MILRHILYHMTHGFVNPNETGVIDNISEMWYNYL